MKLVVLAILLALCIGCGSEVQPAGIEIPAYEPPTWEPKIYLSIWITDTEGVDHWYHLDLPIEEGPKIIEALRPWISEQLREGRNYEVECLSIHLYGR